MRASPDWGSEARVGEGLAGTRARASAQVALVAAAILTSLLAAAQIEAPGSDPSRVAAIFPPWWSGQRAITAAASVGEILGVGGAPFVVILHGDPSNLARRVRAAGALLTLSSNPAGLCTPRPLESKS
jgi:hypothetical protein